MRDSVRKHLRKWLIGIGCTLSVAILFQQARVSDTFQSRTTNEPSVSEQVSSPSNDQNDRADRDIFEAPAESERGSFGFRSQSRQS